MDHQANILTLFQKYLAGQYTEEELETLLVYFQLPNESELLTDLILQELDRDTDIAQQNAVQGLADTIGTRLLQKIERPAPIRPLWLFLRIAVAVLLMASAGGMFYYYVVRQETTESLRMSKY